MAQPWGESRFGVVCGQGKLAGGGPAVVLRQIRRRPPGAPEPGGSAPGRVGIAPLPAGTPVRLLCPRELAAQSTQLAELVVSLVDGGDVDVGQVVYDPRSLFLAAVQSPETCRSWQRCTRQIPVNTTAAGSPTSQVAVASVQSRARPMSATWRQAAIRWQ